MYPLNLTPKRLYIHSKLLNYSKGLKQSNKRKKRLPRGSIQSARQNAIKIRLILLTLPI